MWHIQGSSGITGDAFFVVVLPQFPPLTNTEHVTVGQGWKVKRKPEVAMPLKHTHTLEIS